MNALSAAPHIIRSIFGFDFVSIGMIGFPGNSLKWLYTSGATNDRHKRIVLPPGIGIGGIVIKTQCPLLCCDLDAEIDPRDYATYPIVFAEDLRSFAAFPLITDAVIAGVLLCAFREASPAHRDLYYRLCSFLNQGFCGYNVGTDNFQSLTRSEGIDPTAMLSLKEREVFELLARGFTNKEISEQLFSSVKTIETHRRNIYRKLDVSTRAELVQLAITYHLIT